MTVTEQQHTYLYLSDEEQALVIEALTAYGKSHEPAVKPQLDRIVNRINWLNQIKEMKK